MHNSKNDYRNGFVLLIMYIEIQTISVALSLSPLLMLQNQFYIDNIVETIIFSLQLRVVYPKYVLKGKGVADFLTS